jgi:glycosyltransferase involved in cell wall biosynthesis
MPGRSLLFVVDSRLGHATRRARGAVFREAFEREGWKVSFADAATDRPADIVAAARGHEIVCLLKVGSLGLVRRLRRETRARIAFDLTDPLWKRAHRRAGWHDLDRILRLADVVLCENAVTRDYALRYNPNVALVPASAQTELFDAARDAARASLPLPARADGRVVIGWVGSRGTAGALAKVREPLRRVCARHPEVMLRVAGCRVEDAARALEGMPHTVRPEYDEAGMIQEMLSLDIGLFPAPLDAEDYRVRGALKALLYMGAGVPPVCQAGGDCSEIIEDGVTGMLADGPEEWERKIEALVVSPGLRRSMGEAALAFSRRERSLARVQARLRDALLGALDGPVASNPPPFAPTAPTAPTRAREFLSSLGFRAEALEDRDHRRPGPYRVPLHPCHPARGIYRRVAGRQPRHAPPQFVVRPAVRRPLSVRRGGRAVRGSATPVRRHGRRRPSGRDRRGRNQL